MTVLWPPPLLHRPLPPAGSLAPIMVYLSRSHRQWAHPGLGALPALPRDGQLWYEWREWGWGQGDLEA